jgi:CRISPR system Cascade subunit CasA
VLNLLTDPWLPVIRHQIGRCVISPAQITESYDKYPVIAIDWPRPDFRVATLELLTGLLATMVPPRGSDEWLEWWHEPPGAAALELGFARFAPAFMLDGNGPRFLQDLEDFDSDSEQIERLLIEAPGAVTVIKNTDLMTHRGGISNLCRAAAAIALYTFQSWAPAGGAGNRAGLRGGGPLVTMVMPGTKPTLWQTLWANVPAGGLPPAPHELPRVFPWLAPSVTSEGTKVVTPQDAHPLLCWWGMPRRIRLDFATFKPGRTCDLTGMPDNVQVVSWRQRPRGAHYVAWGGAHPLTPHYRQTIGDEQRAVHPQQGGIVYRHWRGLVFGTEDGLRVPAATVSDWRAWRGIDTGVQQSRLIIAGFDMDNMKACAFVENEMPLYVAPSKDAQCWSDNLASDLVQAANQVATLLRFAVRNALISPGTTVRSNAALLNAVQDTFYQETQSRFYALLEVFLQHPFEASDAYRADWLKHLTRIALAIFDEAAPLSVDTDSAAAPRTGKARQFLASALAGCGTAGATLFTTLGLPLTEQKETKNRRRYEHPNSRSRRLVARSAA